MELLCLWRYFGFVFLCLIASHFKKHGSTVKPNIHIVQLYILFYVKHVIRKTRFLLKPQDLSEEMFFVFVFLAQVVHELLNIFLCFSSWKILALVLLTGSWKQFSLSPFCAFFNFANHVYRKDIANDILWIEIYSFECSSPLKIQLYKNFVILLVNHFNKINTKSFEKKETCISQSAVETECDQMY